MFDYVGGREQKLHLWNNIKIIYGQLNIGTITLFHILLPQGPTGAFAGSPLVSPGSSWKTAGQECVIRLTQLSPAPCKRKDIWFINTVETLSPKQQTFSAFMFSSILTLNMPVRLFVNCVFYLKLSSSFLPFFPLSFDFCFFFSLDSCLWSKLLPFDIMP